MSEYGLHIVLALIAGLAGGIISSRFFARGPVLTEKEPKPSKVIYAEEFRLVDMDGTCLAKLLSKVPNLPGGPFLSFYDKDGRTRSLLWLRENGDPNMMYYDKDGEVRLDLALANGLPSLVWYDKNRKGRSVWSLLENGQPYMLYCDKEGYSAAHLVWANRESLI